MIPTLGNRGSRFSSVATKISVPELASIFLTARNSWDFRSLESCEKHWFEDFKEGRTFCYLAEATGNGSGQFGAAFTTAVSENFTTGACLVTLAESEFSGAAQLGWIVGRFHWKKDQSKLSTAKVKP